MNTTQWSALYRILNTNRTRFAGVLAFAVGLNLVFSVVDPFVTKFLIDDGVMQQNVDQFLLYAGLAVGVGLTVRAGFYVQKLMAQRLRNRVNEYLTGTLMDRVFSLPYLHLQNNNTGYFVSRIYDEPSKIARQLDEALIGTVKAGVMMIASLGVALYLSWQTTVFLCTVVPLLYVLSNRYGKQIYTESQQENEAEAELRERVEHGVDAYETVRLFGLKSVVLTRVEEKLDAYLQALYTRVETSERFRLMSRVSMSLSEVLVLIAAGYSVMQGSMTVGGLVAYLNVFWKLVRGAKQTADKVPDVSQLLGYAERVLEMMDEADAAQAAGSTRRNAGAAGDGAPVANGHGKTAQEEGVQKGHSQAEEVRKDGGGDIVMQEAELGYDGEPVLTEVTLRIRTNRCENVLVRGPNGSGKSTLALAMTGLLPPMRGTVQTLPPGRISALLRSFRFATPSLADHIPEGNDGSVQADDLQALVRRFELEEALADGADANDLSTGQQSKAQIIVTALQPADVVIVDEPLTGVDTESCDRVMETLLERTRDKTLVTIMHGHDAYVPHFDRIVHVRDGSVRVAEAGEAPSL